MKAIVTTEFPGRPDGEALARIIAVDEVIFGDLARVAVDEGLAEIVEDAPIEPEEPTIDLELLTVDDLKALAEKRNVDLSGATKKAEIVAALKAVEQSAA